MWYSSYLHRSTRAAELGVLSHEKNIALALGGVLVCVSIVGAYQWENGLMKLYDVTLSSNPNFKVPRA